MAASAPADAGWDGLSGPFPARQEHPEAPPKRAVMDEMELAQDQCRWIPSEVLQDTTCQQKELGLSFRCCEKKTCPRCASQHQIEGGYEDPVEYLSAAVFILEKLDAYKTHENYARRREELKNSSYQWVWIVAEAIKHTKDISHYGAIVIPAVQAQKICEEKKLGDYFVYRKWSSDLRSFDYLLAMDPGNLHYFSWWKVNLEERNALPEFEKLINWSTNMELWGDVVEACTGIFFVAERVPELQKFLDCDFLPEGVSSWMILHSLSDSIRNFVGSR